MIRQTPYHRQMLAMGAEMVDRLGFAAPANFGCGREEHLATRHSVGIFDVYYQTAVEVVGGDSADLLQVAAVNDVSSLTPGKVLYTSLCNEQGGIIDDLTIFKLSNDRFWLCPTPSRVDVVADWLEQLAIGMNAWVTDLGYRNAYLSIQGPNSRALLSELTTSDVSAESLKPFTFTSSTVADVPKTMISRTGYSGELGYELFYPIEYAEHMWDAVFRTGEKFGAKPCGLEALRSLRMEKRFPLYGLDVDESTTPIEAGLTWTVKFEKGTFIGRDALLEQYHRGVTHRLVLLSVDDIEVDLAPGDVVRTRANGDSVVRSAAKGYAVNSSLGMAYLPVADASEGNSVEVIDKPGNSHLARVHLKAVYDPERKRFAA